MPDLLQVHCLAACPAPSPLSWGLQDGTSRGKQVGWEIKLEKALLPHVMCALVSPGGEGGSGDGSDPPGPRRFPSVKAPQGGALWGLGSNPSPDTQRFPRAPLCLSFPYHLEECTGHGYLQPECRPPVVASLQQKLHSVPNPGSNAAVPATESPDHLAPWSGSPLPTNLLTELFSFIPAVFPFFSYLRVCSSPIYYSPLP